LARFLKIEFGGLGDLHRTTIADLGRVELWVDILKRVKAKWR
jgi:hypothetical protein